MFLKEESTKDGADSLASASTLCRRGLGGLLVRGQRYLFFLRRSPYGQNAVLHESRAGGGRPGHRAGQRHYVLVVSADEGFVLGRFEVQGPIHRPSEHEQPGILPEVEEPVDVVRFSGPPGHFEFIR